MEQSLQEFVDSRGVEISADRRQGVVRGVKILGLRSRNGRLYLPEALAQAGRLYEGAKVNVNHPKGDPAGPRDYQDRMGVIRNVAFRPDEGLFADFHFNPKHSLAEQLLWDAEHAPENVGFSHNVQARIARRGDETVVEEILRVQSVDLVADPATTRGLFEASPDESAEPLIALLSSLTADQLKAHRPELVAEMLAEPMGQLEQLRAELSQLREADRLRCRRGRMKQLLAEFGLPDPDAGDAWAKAAVSPRFIEQLLASPDDPSMRDLIEERANLLRLSHERREGDPPAAPQSRDQHQVCSPATTDVKAFVEAIS